MRLSILSACAVSLVVTSSALAQAPAAAKVDPPLFGSVYSQTTPNRIVFTCKPLDATGTRIECDFTETALHPPKPLAEVNNAIIEDEARNRAEFAKNTPEAWRQVCPNHPPDPAFLSGATEEERKLAYAILDACKRRDLEGLFRVIASATRAKQTSTCSIELTSHWKTVLARTPQGTWQGASGLSAGCYHYISTTLSRAPNAASAWNYKRVSYASDPSHEAECALDGPSTSTEMHWDYKQEWDVGCRYVKLLAM